MSSDTDIKLDSYLEAIQNHIKSADYDSAQNTLFAIRELMRTKKIVNISNDVDLKLQVCTIKNIRFLIKVRISFFCFRVEIYGNNI